MQTQHSFQVTIPCVLCQFDIYKVILFGGSAVLVITFEKNQFCGSELFFECIKCVRWVVPLI